MSSWCKRYSRIDWSPVPYYDCLVGGNCSHIVCWMLICAAHRMHGVWGLYTSEILPCLSGSVSNKSSDSQSNCSQRVQPQALLLRTHAHAWSLSKSTGFCSGYSGHISTTLLQFCPPVSLATSPPPSILSPSLTVSVSSFPTPSYFCLSVCPTAPPSLLFAISSFTVKWLPRLSPPAQSLLHRIRYLPRILIMQPPFYTPHKPEIYTWIMLLVKCSPSVHTHRLSIH